MKCFFIVIILCSSIWFPIVFASQAWRWEKNVEEHNAGLLSWRLFNAMESYYEEASRRVKELDFIRFKTETSMEYETGYVMHETIARYKKMVQLMNRMVKFKWDTLYDDLDKTELVQKLYFEIYHLVNMIHEIPGKYQYEKRVPNESDFQNPKQDLPFDKAIQDSEKRKKRERQMVQKFLKQRRELMRQKIYNSTARPDKMQDNMNWPIDYGWEVEG